MQFTKKVVYLGCSPMTLRDGTVLNGLSFFDAEDQQTVSINVQASNTAVCSVLPSLDFGSPCNATFALRDADKRTFRLALVGLSPIQSK